MVHVELWNQSSPAPATVEQFRAKTPFDTETNRQFFLLKTGS